MLTGKEVDKGLKKLNLVFTSDKRQGLMRQKIGKDFRYYTSDGKKITSKKTLKRIKKLVVPPAWENVWICPSSKGHLQATGYDEKGRKQYIYHLQWIRYCQDNKFNKMVDFGRVLPKIRQKVRADMKLSGMQRKKVIATIVWLLEHTFVRIGNNEYARENDSYGLTTLRNRHAKVKGDTVKLEFIGKSGVSHKVDISHPIIAKTIRSCIELPGYALFQYLDEEGKRHEIDSAHVNQYLKEITGEDFTAKDFRTWGGTLIGALELNKRYRPSSKKDLKKNISEAVKVVSSHLGNTPAVCRNYYIHPTIIKSYQNNILINFQSKAQKETGLTKYEQSLIKWLEKYPTI